jgi:DUF1365 family protein
LFFLFRFSDADFSANEFKELYNRRIHGALILEGGETPDAFVRKLKPESLLGLFFNTFGW